MQAGFHAHDKDHSGSLDGRELAIAVRESGFSLDAHSFQAVQRAFDFEIDGKVGTTIDRDAVTSHRDTSIHRSGQERVIF